MYTYNIIVRKYFRTFVLSYENRIFPEIDTKILSYLRRIQLRVLYCMITTYFRTFESISISPSVQRNVLYVYNVVRVHVQLYTYGNISGNIYLRVQYTYCSVRVQ